MSYENKILQMKKMLSKKSEVAATTVEEPHFQTPDTPSYVESWQQAGLTRIDNGFGIVFKREEHYPLSFRHGNYELASYFEAVEKWQGADFSHPFSLDSNEKVLFFDTETTGLKGVGTQIFLLGFLSFNGEEFVLSQYVLADPAHEVAMLFESKLWQEQATIITYNGKSFDWPLLETRWTLNRKQLPKLKLQRQMDLLHSSKRLWKNDMERMKLKSVEEEKLGFVRKGDIPGFLAPIIYLDAVKSGNPDALMKVLLHNEWDLLSLVTLYVHSTNLLFEQDEEESSTTYTNIGKWYADLKEGAQSERILEKVAASYNALEAGDAQYYLAFQHKRNKRFNDAVVAFVAALHFVDSKKKLQVLEELAKIHEHQFKDYELAEKYTKQGIEHLEYAENISAEQKQKREILWEKRLKRVGNKK
ncbi:MAG: ribonuclease H-like domain-containing protein [Lysinibacillus sp.]